MAGAESGVARALPGGARNGAGVVGATAVTAMAAFPGANGRIAFSSDRAGISDVWVMDRNGASPTNVTHYIIDRTRRTGNDHISRSCER